MTRTLAVFTILRTTGKSILWAIASLAAISFLTACSNVEPVLKSLSLEMDTLSFSGSTEKTFRVYSLSQPKTLTGQCDARVEALSFSLDESSWAASSAFLGDESDIDCRDGSITLIIDPSKFNFPANLAEGESSTRTIWIRGSTPYGHAASARVHVTYVKDSVSPTIGSLASSDGPIQNIADGTTSDISGTCTTGDSAVSVSARDSNGVVASAAAIPCINGAFIAAEFSFATLSDGVITITATQSDEAGNPPGTATISVTKDLTAPVVAMNPPATGTFINSINDASFTITGICDSSESTGVSFFHGSIALGGTTCVAGNTFSASMDLSALSDGGVTLKVTQTDASGNVGSDDQAFTKDTTPPADPGSITLAVAYSNDTTQSPTINYAAISDLNGVSKVEYKIIQGVSTVYRNWTTAPASGNKVPGPFVDGVTYRLVLRAHDIPGNISDAFALQPTWTVDTIAPEVEITNYINGQRIGNAEVTNGLTISGTCEANLQVNYWGGLGGSGWNDGMLPSSTTCTSGGTFTYVVPAIVFSTSGTYRFYAKQIDQTGVNQNTAQVDLDLDIINPSVTIDSPVAGTYLGTSSTTVAGTCTTGDSSVEIKVNGATQGSTACVAGNYSIVISNTGFTDGTYNFEARQTDASNNVGLDVESFLKDTTAPTASYNDLQSQFTSSVSQTAIFVFDAEDNVGGSGFKHAETMVLDSNGNLILDWGIHASGQARPGTFVVGERYTLHAKYVDQAGNYSAPQAINSWEIDVTPPAIDDFYVDYTLADPAGVITPPVTVLWTETGSGVARVTISLKNRITNAVITTDQAYTGTSLGQLNGGRTLGPFTGAPFNLVDSFEIKVRVHDYAGNSSEEMMSTWEACPPDTVTWSRPASEHPSIAFSGTFVVPERCAGKAVLIKALGEPGRTSLGGHIAEKGVGSGAFVSGVFSGATLAGRTLNIRFGGAGPAGHGDTGNAARWGGRYAAVNGVKSDGSSRIAVIAGGGGGIGADMRTLLPANTAFNLPGLGGDRGRGQGRCSPSSTGNDRTVCGVNGNAVGSATINFGDPSGLAVSNGGAKGANNGLCDGYAFASGGEGASLDLNGIEGTGGRGLQVDSDVLKVGGGGGGGFGGGGGGGSYKSSGICYGGSGGGGGSLVYGQIPGTVEAIVAGVNQGDAHIAITYGLSLPSIQCPANFVYIPKMRAPDGQDYSVNDIDPQNGFCISKYEMSGSLDQPMAVPLEEPIKGATHAEAQAACLKLGEDYSLISSEQWQSVAQIAHWNIRNWENGDIGHTAKEMNVGMYSDVKASESLAASNDESSPCFGTISSCSSVDRFAWNIARRTHVLGTSSSAPTIWDMGGSLKEMVRGHHTRASGVGIALNTIQKLTGDLLLLDAFGYYFPTTRYNYGDPSSTSLSLGQINLIADPAANLTRGGSYLQTSSQAGLFSIVTATPTGESDRGFRCVREPVQ